MRQQVSPPSPALQERLQTLRHVALDMDGTLYQGKTLFAFTNPTLELFNRLGIGYSFLTNNSSKSVTDYAVNLRQMGMAADAGQIYTSAQATIEYLREAHPALRRLFLVGTASLQREFMEAGFELTSHHVTDVPDAVVVGFDLDPRYSVLCRAAFWIKKGLPYFATHPDRVCPTDEPTVLIDCGSICAALASASGRSPDAIPGKPDSRMLLGLGRRLGLHSGEMAMIGDRLYTDVEMALRAGALAVLVLSGEATEADVSHATRKPDLVMRDLGEFGELLQRARL